MNRAPMTRAMLITRNPLRLPPRAALGFLRRRRVVGGSLALAGLRQAQAAEWPDRPVRLIIGVPPGQGPDTMARALAPFLAEAFGRPFVVDNRPGAGGVVGATAVAQARDGHTLGFVLGGPTTVARVLNPNVPYEPARDFVPISLLTRVPFVLTVSPDLGVTDLAGFLALVRARPGAFAYASIGPGTVTHLAMEELKHAQQLDIAHVAYRGFPDATRDLLGGRVQAMFNVPGVALELLRAGRLVGVAQSGGARLATLPDTPTLEEAGLATRFFGWTGIVAPAGFPPEVAVRIAQVVGAALRDHPEARGRLDLAGNEILGTDPAELARLQASEAARWSAVITRLGLRHSD
jgi:tripartite-type tricarboxylate transporter receptor subunit TctC